MKIPPSLIGTIGRVMAEAYTHAQLDTIFLSAGFPEIVPDGSKPTKVQQWMRDANNQLPNPMHNLGRAIAEFMDQTGPDPVELEHNEFARNRADTYQSHRGGIERALQSEGLVYYRGGRITRGGISGASASLEQQLVDRPIETVQEEFDRAFQNVDQSPRQALDAACAILESICKYYLVQNGQTLPNDQSIKPLWTTTAKHLGLHPGQIEDDDLKRILSGMFSVVDGIGALRTHAGGAHGRLEPTSGKKNYQVLPRHARLAIHSAHTLSLFVLETWEDRGADG